MEEVPCPKCKEAFGNLGYHWSFNESHRPDFTNRQKGVITGLCMGDGFISTRNKNPYLEVSMINKEYLEYLNKIFGSLSTNVRLKSSAQESASNARKGGLNPNAQEENYSNVYRWRTRTHPELEEFAGWYQDGGKRWPEDILLTPTVLTHWYVSDGTWNTWGTGDYITISTSKEMKNEEKVENYFSSIHLPEPDRWRKSERNDKSITCSLVWSKENTYRLFEYMNGPIPGFEHKFPGGN